jgi:hypothetical protein
LSCSAAMQKPRIRSASTTALHVITTRSFARELGVMSWSLVAFTRRRGSVATVALFFRRGFARWLIRRTRQALTLYNCKK